MSTEATVSLCMIVRDEERSLARCLESAAPVVDEMCIVDTGSTDRSVEIAEHYGARIERFAWSDSFAEARNVSLAMARGEWILVLDADESLDPASQATLRAVVDGAFDSAAADAKPAVRPLGALARLVDHIDGEIHDGWVMRLFRNAPDHRYVGAIHNRLGPVFDARAEEPGNKVLMCDELVIHHFGYARATWDAKQKTARSQRLFARALRDDPNDLFVLYKYADFQRGHDASAALESLATLCDRIAGLPPAEQRRHAWHSEVFALCAMEQMKAGQLEAAASRLEQSEGCEATANLHFVCGVFGLITERWDDAFRHFDAARRIDGPARIQPPWPGVATWKSALGMVRALRGAGRAPEAELLLRHAVEAYPEASELRAEPASRAPTPAAGC